MGWPPQSTRASWPAKKCSLVDATRAGTQVVGGTPTPTVTVTQNAQSVLTSQVTYAGAVQTAFGGIFGVQQMAVRGSATSSLTLPKWMNISVAIDISQSMGLAATSAGITKLQGLTPDNCAFGCHVVSQDQAGTAYQTPYEKIAENNGVQLRIDVISDEYVEHDSDRGE